MAIVNDTFTDTNGVTLSAHVGEEGAVWVQHASYVASTLEIQSNQVRMVGASSPALVYYASGVPPDASYEAKCIAKIFGTGGTGNIGPALGIDISADTMYWGTFDAAAGGFRIRKMVAGVGPTLINSGGAGTLADGDEIKLTWVGTALTLFKNGVQVAAGTDSSISAAGATGIRLQTNNGANRLEIDNFTATDIVAATQITIDGPATSSFGSASSNFTVGADGSITGTITVTPDESAGTGTFTPTTVQISNASPTATFTYTGSSVGARDITTSDDGGLANTDVVAHTVNAVAPSAPTIDTATEDAGNDGTVDITFTANSDGGAAVTAANATGSLGDNGSSAGSSPIVVTIAAARKGLAQTWTVTQTNSVGTSAASAASNSVAATTLPGVPTGVHASATGTTTGRVYGVAPVDTGGLAVTYIADDGLGGHTTADGALPRNLTGLSGTITPRLKSHNSLGDSAYVASGNAITPAAACKIMERVHYLTTDALGAKIFTIWELVAGALSQIGGSHTGEFVDGANGQITNAWDIDLFTPPNGAFGDFFGLMKVGNVNGGSFAQALYSPPTEVYTEAKEVKISTFLASDTIGVVQNKTLTLSAASVGTGRTATAGSATFAGDATDVGKFITVPAGGAGRAVITASGTTTVCTVQILEAFAGTSISANGWAYGQPGYRLRFFDGTFGSRVTSGIVAIPDCVNQFATLLTLTPPDQLQYKILWDCGN